MLRDLIRGPALERPLVWAIRVYVGGGLFYDRAPFGSAHEAHARLHALAIHPDRPLLGHRAAVVRIRPKEFVNYER